MSQETCSNKNCNCGKSHVYKDELSGLPVGEAHDKFEDKKEGLKKNIIELELKKRPWVSLHTHDFFSILDGSGKAEDYIKLAKEYNHPAISLTNHGNVSGNYDFYKKAKAAGIKPIIGVEAYVNNKMGDFEEKKFEGGNSHQIILVKNQEGYINLNRLMYKSFTEGFYKRGRIKTDWLIEHKEGLFITTSCAISEMALLLKSGKEKEAEDYLKRLIDAFGENIAAEFQFNEYDFQKPYNAWLLKMSKKYNMLQIITNDIHYANKEDSALQDTIISINQKTQLSDPKAFKLGTRHLYYPSVEDIYEFNKKFGFNYPEHFIDRCVENTLKVADKCNFDFDTTTEKYPRYEPSQDIIDYFKTTDTKEIITRLSRAKLKQKIAEYKKNGLVNMTPEKEKEYYDRLTFELDVIGSKNALDYFMVYWDLIRDYKEKGYNIGPGRGSASGSLLSFALGIVTIDPIRFDLYFERFLNPTRKSNPDIDLDIEADSDHVIKEYLYNKYGKERVLNVAAFSTFSEKGTLKDVVRAHLGEDAAGFQSDVHAVTQEMPNFDKVEYSLKDWFQNWPKDKACTERVRQWLLNPENTTILKQTIQLQGSIKGVSQHAAGVVITPGPSWEYLPTNIVASSKNIVTAFQEADKSGKDLSELLISKLDILKIESLNTIKEAIAIVKENKGIDISDKVYNVDLEDKNLFQELRLGVNGGIFQFESLGMNALLKGMFCDNFEELSAANALYRPGAMGIKAHEEYVKNKFNPKGIKYVHQALASILDKTNGVLVYQEQLMFLANKIGGMTLGEGDQLRRYMDKASQAIKKKAANETMTSKDEANYKEFDKYWNKFLDGAEKNGYKKEEIDVIKNYIAQYLGYSFNRCLTKNHTVRHREKGVIPISEVQAGDYILGYNPKNKKDEYNMVKKIHHNGIKPVFKITTDKNKELECTMEHKLFTEAGMVEMKNVIENDLCVKTL